MKSSIPVLLVIFSTFQSITQVHPYLFPYEPRNPLDGTPAPVGSLWPKPQQAQTKETFFTVDTDNFQIILVRGETFEPIQCSTLDWARDHYTQLIHNLKPSENNTSAPVGISSLVIELDDECPEIAYPSAGNAVEEFYHLFVERNSSGGEKARLQANGPFAALRGIESFYQLLWAENDEYTIYNVNQTDITDFPRFTHRGIMLDTARHYLPEKILVQLLTVMMYNKFNVFHWHIVDDQSFPYVSRKFPELSAKGAYNKGAVFTPEAVQRIIEAARVRGIRVILEFDTPGHAGGFGKSHRELLTPCFGDGVTPGTPNYPEHTDYENLDPSNDNVYTFMKDLFTEIVQNVSKDPYIHLGMDEVYTPCWESSPLIKQFMKDNGYVNISQVQAHYTQRHVQMIKSLNVTPIAWQDPLDAKVDLDKDVVIQVWKDYGESKWDVAVQNALRRGHKVILSAPWYINYINYGESWRNYYEIDPIAGANVTDGQIPQVLGGEAAIWGEFVDQTNVVARLFPFSSAVAEVLWTPGDKKDSTADAKWRLDIFRCSLLRRGIRAQPVLNGHCGAFETTLDL